VNESLRPTREIETEPQDPQRTKSLVDRYRSLGPVAQAAIPGCYAWVTTVLPVAWSSANLARAASLGALLLLVSAVVVEQRHGATLARVAPKPARAFAHALCIWGFSGMSAIVWALASPRALRLFDSARGMAGAAGWMLFAFSASAPVLRRSVDETRLQRAPNARGHSSKGDGAVLLACLVAILSLQGMGWAADEPERGVLIRLVAIALSMGLVSCATVLISSRRLDVEAKAPQVSAMAWFFAVLAIVALGATLFR
jgi:hypothetical protein